MLSCEEVDGSVVNDDDCDDGDGAVFPGADEVCDEADQDCDELVDEDATDALTWYYDEDGDGFGLEESTTLACDEPEDYADTLGDCDDADAQVHPDMPEICDGVDQDCDVSVDEGTGGTAATYYADFDEDGYGDAASSLVTCDERPTGFVEDASDCDDSDALVHPGALEICDGVRNDCEDSAWSADDQIVSFLDDGGAWSDLTGSIGGGTSTEPAVMELDDDGVVMFCDGTYYANLISDGSEVALASLNGAISTVISGGGADSVIYANDSVLELTGVTITGGAAASGGGMYLGTTTAVLTDVVISGNYAATSGGGAYFHASDISLIDSVITSNGAGTFGGGVVVETSTLRLSEVALDGNASSYGGAIYAHGGDLILDACSVTGNTDYFASGGSLYLWASEADVDDTDFSGNTPYDTFVQDVEEHYTWSKAATFDCDVTGCD